MSDLWHDDVPSAFIGAVFDRMRMADWHTFQLLTKRHARLRSLGRTATYGEGWPLPNVWLGVSVEDQHWANIRVPALLETPAAVRFLSCEPLLGPVSFRWAKWHDWRDANHLDGLRGIDWVIIGGESGPNARPLDIGWVRDIVAQCREAGVAPFVKQLGSVWASQNGGPVWRDSHGSNWDLWPEDLRVREFPQAEVPVNV